MLVMFVSIFIWNGDGILFAIAMLQDYRDRLLIKRTIKTVNHPVVMNLVLITDRVMF